MQKYSSCQKDFFKFEIVRAPLATFDTIDLGSDDDSSIHVQHSSLSDRSFPTTCSQSSRDSFDSTGENSSFDHNSDCPGNSQYSESDSGTSTPTNEPVEFISTDRLKKQVLRERLNTEINIIERTRPSVVAEPAIVLKLDANISDKFKKKRSNSSSSDSDSDVFTFENIQTRHKKNASNNIDGKDLQDKSVDPVNLSPILLDPSQIKSPSKRKAYEKRLQRLQVTTSPIARPRSTTPINVVTLDEYIASSPEFSPTTEKLKIVLPADEFTPKPKTPRKSTRKDSESDFNEELLFSRSKSALVVDQAGHLPVSPKRVLIPPNISPATSPKISPASKLKLENQGSTKYVYIRSPTHAISPLATGEEENWATFPDTPSTLGQSNKDNVRSDPSDIDMCDVGEEVLTVNIENKPNLGQCNIELTLSASNSSNSMNPSPDSSSIVTTTNPLGQDHTESELDFPMDTSEDDTGSSSNKNGSCRTPDSDQY
ncbi:hypothetical protein LOTGIDRAFT_163046 [Lottia gigantea]|uniref:Uncharacterized protein n=1 Tax=Lottia gigantea TaxID=225164 RepID=V4AFA9_LOTGI|nr:hypothetical protein LOTGIDRAFT_163046 [Lottia gigantea]ESO92041.1 hypothetical protein LOTGIDRAFT_163046 [Lottia gigantea]